MSKATAKSPSLPAWGELVRRGERLDGDSLRLGGGTTVVYAA
jgi:hypothetical protein